MASTVADPAACEMCARSVGPHQCAPPSVVRVGTDYGTSA